MAARMTGRMTEDQVREIVRQELTLWLGKPGPSGSERLGQLIERQAIAAAEKRLVQGDAS